MSRGWLQPTEKGSREVIIQLQQDYSGVRQKKETKDKTMSMEEGLRGKRLAVETMLMCISKKNFARESPEQW